MRHISFLNTLSIFCGIFLNRPASACECECPTASVEDPQTVTITPVEPEVPSERTFTEVPLTFPPVVSADGTVTIVAGVMTPEFVIHRAFDEKMIESAWLAPFTCEELDRVIHAVYARHNFYFLNGDTRTFFLHFDLHYRPDMNLRVTEIEAKFRSQDQLTLLRVEMAIESHGCASDHRVVD